MGIAGGTLGPMNVIMGIFMENATQITQLNRDMQVQEVIEQEKKIEDGLRKIFEDLDDDKSGTLSWEEFESNLENDRIRGYLATLGIEVWKAKSLFKMVDIDDTNNVPIDDFTQGCMRLKGTARSI